MQAIRKHTNLVDFLAMLGPPFWSPVAGLWPSGLSKLSPEDAGSISAAQTGLGTSWTSSSSPFRSWSAVLTSWQKRAAQSRSRWGLASSSQRFCFVLLFNRKMNKYCCFNLLILCDGLESRRRK